MSSYYTTAQLEAMRKTRLKQELADSIQRLKEQLQIKYDNNIQVTDGLNIETTVFITDDSVGGYSKSTFVTGSALQTKESHDVVKRNDLDFSDLLFSLHKKPTKLEQELDSWIKKMDKRPILSERDEIDRTRLLAELARIVQSSSMDIEDKIGLVKMHVSTYLQGSVMITDADKEKMKSIYLEYCTLCEMLEIMPTEKLPYRVEKEVTRLTSVLEKRRQDEYVMGVIEAIMEDLGCNVKDDAVLDHTIGQMYAIDGHPLCDVFIGNDGSGIMFEPVGESKGVSLERRRQIEDSANAVCSLYDKLEERAAEKGVILKRVYADPVSIDEMCFQSDISERSTRKNRRKISIQRQQALNSED